MKLHELISHPDVQLPIKRGARDAGEFVKLTLHRFQELLDELELCKVNDYVRQHRVSIDKCCIGLINTVRGALEGRIPDAYAEFDSAISAIRSVLDEKAIDLSAQHLGLMFRVRRTRFATLSKEEMFHIPFENRHEVKGHRYSIPGLPCLYTCGSLYACWEEMGRPPLHELQVAALWTKRNRQLKILDLTTRPASLADWTQCEGEIVGRDKVERDLSNHLISLAIDLYVLHRGDAP